MAKDLINGYVVVETHKGITTIEFFHPQSNSLPHRILEDLANEIHDAGRNHETKVIILRSQAKKHFALELHSMNYLKLKTQLRALNSLVDLQM